MNAEQFHDALSGLPDDLIAEADTRRQRRKSTIPFRRWASMAACFAAVLVVSLFALNTGSLKRVPKTESLAVDTADSVVSEEMAPAAPAEGSGAGQDRNMSPAAEAAPAESNANQTAGSAPSVVVQPEGIARSLPKEEAISIANILKNLDYRGENQCECIAQIAIVVDGQTRYAINLEEGFVRCQAGQAALTPEEVRILREILMPYC